MRLQQQQNHYIGRGEGRERDKNSHFGQASKQEGNELQGSLTKTQQSEKVTPSKMKTWQTENDFNINALKPLKKHKRKISPPNVFETKSVR